MTDPQKQLQILLSEEFRGEELALLVHNHFPALSGERNVLHALSQKSSLDQLFAVLYRTRPDRSTELERLEDALAQRKDTSSSEKNTSSSEKNTSSSEKNTSSSEEGDPSSVGDVFVSGFAAAALSPAVTGRSLRDAVLSGSLTRNAALQVVIQLADMLQHRRSAHGAVEPRNIRLVAGHPPALTAGALLGDFYRPFEVTIGDASDVRIDVYSLARTAVFCLHQAPIPPRAAHDVVRFIRKLPVADPIRRVLVRAAGRPLAEGYADMASFADHLRAAWSGDMDLLLVETPRPIRMVLVAGGASCVGGEPLPGVHRHVAVSWVPTDCAVGRFRLSETPVTQAQWAAVLGERLPCPARHTEPDAPVERVQWLEAIRFLNALSKREKRRPAYRIYRGDQVEWYPDRDGYRLPTELEWEHACRGGTRTRFHSGAGEDALDAAGWYIGNTGGAGTMPVRWKAPNALGLYDMHGNVGEWCWDAWSDSPGPRSPQLVQSKKSGVRVYRGGGWVLSAVLCASGCRSRARIDGKTRHDYIGFRVAQSVLG